VNEGIAHCRFELGFLVKQWWKAFFLEEDVCHSAVFAWKSWIQSLCLYFGFFPTVKVQSRLLPATPCELDILVKDQGKERGKPGEVSEFIYIPCQGQHMVMHVIQQWTFLVNLLKPLRGILNCRDLRLNFVIHKQEWKCFIT